MSVLVQGLLGTWCSRALAQSGGERSGDGPELSSKTPLTLGSLRIQDKFRNAYIMLGENVQ